MKQITITDVENNKSYTFNDTRAEGSFIEKVEGFEYATVIEAIEDIPNDGGAYYVNSKFSSRRVGITALITCDRLEQRLELLAALNQTGHLKLIEFTTLDDKQLQFYAMVKNLVFPYTTMETPLLLELIAPDYRFYGQTLKEFETAESQIFGGAEIPATIPMSLAPDAATYNLVNDGNGTMQPIFRIDGPGTSFIVGNDTTDEEFTITYDLEVGEYILIDPANESILLNGVTDIYSAFDGNFWSVVPGDNTIHFDVEDGGPATLLTVYYRDTYNGV